MTMTATQEQGSWPQDRRHPVRERYEARAWRDVGLTIEDARRLAEEHSRLRADPSSGPVQRAVEVLDVNERRRLMRAIAAAYGRLYLSAPGELIWMGFAAIAVNDGVAPASALAALAAGYGSNDGLLSPVLRALLDGRRARGPRALADGGVKASFEANYAIFADLYWVHLAYRDGGIEVLRTLHREDALDRTILDGFSLMDEGSRRPDRAEGHDNIVAGNLLLFRSEQLAAVTPVFTKYRDAMSAATRLGLITVPNAQLRQSCAALGRSPAFRDAHDEETSYGPFSARWRWLTTCSWEPLVRLHRDVAAGGGRAILEAEVRRAVAGRREPLRDAARWGSKRLAGRLRQAALRLVGPVLGACPATT
jgi:hypothetical protein